MMASSNSGGTRAGGAEPGRRANFLTIAILCFVLSCLGVGAELLGVKGDLNNNRFDFKSFISDPPVIHEMLYAIEWPNVSQQGPDSPQPRRMFFLVSWESPQRFVMTIAPSLVELTNTGGAVPSKKWICASESRWWRLGLIRPNEYLVSVWHTATPSDLERNPVVVAINSERDAFLDHALKLGICLAPARGIVWEGDQFSYTNEINNTTGSGHVVRDQTGRVKTLFHTFSKPAPLGTGTEIRTGRHRAEYVYGGSDELPTDFPSGIELFALPENRPPFIMERIIFHRIVFSKERLPESKLAFEPLVKGYTLITWAITNDTEYAFDGQRWNPVQMPAAIGTVTQVPRRPRIFVMAMLLATLIPLVFLALKRRKTRA
ncbi:MAG: hypothetical protein NZ739_10845 [Verrucomicrobiae bacterium]|nr:hypothetical protein [Verrucomicrobiae bacterium]